jgi:hypothetical protein
MHDFIKLTPDIMEAVMAFKKTYEELHRKMTKIQIDRFLEIIEITQGYDFTWDTDYDGDLHDKDQGRFASFQPMIPLIMPSLYNSFQICLGRYVTMLLIFTKTRSKSLCMLIYAKSLKRLIGISQSSKKT